MDPEYTWYTLSFLVSFGCYFLAFLPWYSWFIGLFSMPVAIIDILVNIYKVIIDNSLPFSLI